MDRALGLKDRSQPVATEEQAQAEMRAAGRIFGLKARSMAKYRNCPVETAKADISTLAECISERAAWWSERLRSEGINLRLTERLVTAFVTAAHEASRERLDEAAQ
jgi:hypothetical protein